MSAMDFATLNDIIKLFRPLTPIEAERAKALLPVVSASLRTEAAKVGKNLDLMIGQNPAFAAVVRSVTVDVVARALMTSTDGEPMTQQTQTAGVYSTSGTFLVPGGGLFIKNSELARLGLRRQRYGVIDFYGDDKGNHSHAL